ncbi:MAG: glycosyltransferase family 4 protein [Leptospiraceae bacterium]|nr:glycosyltransferase family 4 protein [Leptospiraceae bacterium]
MYYTTVFALPLVKNKSICLPTLHEEIPAYFSIYKKLFTNEITYCFNTPEELKLFQKIYGFYPSKLSVIGMNISIPNNVGEHRGSPLQPMDFVGADHCVCPENDIAETAPYVLYIGRLDVGKKVYELIDFFLEWKNKTVNDVCLLIMGAKPTNFHSKQDVVFTGYVSDTLKYSYIQNSLFLINSSPLESFSIVIMEAWSLKKAVLVNGDSIVLKRHCERSQGGLYYTCQKSFFATMNFLMDNPTIREEMGKNGQKYVEMNYSEGVVQNKLFALVDLSNSLSNSL